MEAPRFLVPRWVFMTGISLLTLTVAAIIFQLAEQNRNLKATLNTYSSAAQARSPFSAGASVPLVNIENLDGESRELGDVLGSGGVLVFLTTTCQYCVRTIPAWTDLASRLADDGKEFVAISLHPRDQTEAYARAWDLDWPLWVLPAESLQALDVRAVPYTVAYSDDQRVVRSWGGALELGLVSEILASVRRTQVDR